MLCVHFIRYTASAKLRRDLNLDGLGLGGEAEEGEAGDARGGGADDPAVDGGGLGFGHEREGVRDIAGRGHVAGVQI